MIFMDLFAELKKKANELATKYAPESLNEEKRFAKSCISVAALVTMADRDAEPSELNMGSRFISGIEEISNTFGEKEANEIFALQISSLQKNASNIAMFTMAVNSMIAEIKDGVVNPAWKKTILSIAEAMGSSNSNGIAGPDEEAMIGKIKIAMV